MCWYMVPEYGEPHLASNSEVYDENKLKKEFHTKRQDKQRARSPWEASLARNNLDFPMRTSIPLPVNNIIIDYQKFKNFKLTINH